MDNAPDSVAWSVLALRPDLATDMLRWDAPQDGDYGCPPLTRQRVQSRPAQTRMADGQGRISPG